MLEPVEVDVNGRKYTVNPFNVMKAFEYYHEFTNAKLNRLPTTSLGLQAVRQCVTPDLKALSDNAVFEKCFSDHPEDLLVLEKLAEDVLTSPFLNSLPGIGKTAKA